jgi:rod shape-determining protein MreC
MHWIIRFIISHRNIASLTAMVVVCLVLLSGNDTQQQRFSRTLMATVFYPFQFYFNQTTRYKNVFDENQRLKEDMALLSIKASALPELIKENERLDTMLSISKPYPYKLVAARVVVRDPSQISRSAIIDVGRDQGILPFMPVMTSQGAVGKIVQVMSHMSLVQLVIDPSNRTSVLAQRSREIGILETENGADFYIMFRAHADVNVGDTIVTSGLGGIYPRGLFAGKITRLSENRDQVFKKAYVLPQVDFDRLQEVFVVKLPPQWSSFKQELDTLVSSASK